jgi:hypothetical protein
LSEREIYVLNTYGYDKDEDGLSNIFHRACKVGKIVNSSVHLRKKIVCVIGIPTIITDIPVHEELVKYCSIIPLRRRQNVHVNDIIKSIISVYQNYEDHLKKAKLGAEWIEKRYRNEDVIHELRKELLH